MKNSGNIILIKQFYLSKTIINANTNMNCINNTGWYMCMVASSGKCMSKNDDIENMPEKGKWT